MVPLALALAIALLPAISLAEILVEDGVLADSDYTFEGMAGGDFAQVESAALEDGGNPGASREFSAQFSGQDGQAVWTLLRDESLDPRALGGFESLDLSLDVLDPELGPFFFLLQDGVRFSPAPLAELPSVVQNGDWFTVSISTVADDWVGFVTDPMPQFSPPDFSDSGLPIQVGFEFAASLELQVPEVRVIDIRSDNLVVAMNVPEPAAAWLLGLVTLALLARAQSSTSSR